MRALTLLFAAILLLALAGYALKDRVRWFAMALMIVAAILGVVLLLAVTKVL